MSTTNIPNEDLMAVNVIVSSLSLIGELSVIVAYIILKKYNAAKVTDKLIISLLISDLVETVADFGFLFTYTNDTLCILNGALRQFGLLCSVMWVVAISHYTMSEDKFPKYYHYLAFSVLVPFTICFLMCLGNMTGWYYGYTFNLIGCLGASTDLLVSLFPPGFIGFAYIFLNYCRLRNILKLINSRETEQEAWGLLIYPLSLLICWIPAFTTRLWMVISGSTAPIFLEGLLIGGMHSMGFINGVYYAFQIRGRLLYVIKNKPKKKNDENDLFSSIMSSININK